MTSGDPVELAKQFFDSAIGGSRGYVAIHAVRYNFPRIHKTLRITPAMSADLNDHISSLEKIVIIADSYAPAQKQRGPSNKEGRSMKRSFGKRAALVFWAVGSCGAVLFSCGLIFMMIQTRKAPFGALALTAFGFILAWEGFKMFKTERNSN